MRVVTGWRQRDTAQSEVIGMVPKFRNFTFWHMFCTGPESLVVNPGLKAE